MDTPSMSPGRDRIGINVIGHVAANLGVAVVTRQVIELIESLGYPVAAFDVDAGTKRPRDDRRFDHLTCANADDLPHPINLFVLGLGALDWALNKCPERFFDGKHLNAIICFWELPIVPAPRLAQLDELDIVIGASDFLRHTFQQSLTHATTIPARLPVSLPDPVPFDRASLGIPASSIAFVFSFDPASDPERKNPVAAMRAFLAGAGECEDAWLVIRLNNAFDASGREHPFVNEFRKLVGGHPRVLLLTGPMTYPEVLGLYQACDVYLSLHRAEGLGLGMAEAMTLGKPVIATGWSGNTTFMTQANACLIDYTMVPVRATHSAYREDRLTSVARWAEPNIDHAAACIAHLCRDGDARAAIGRAARDGMIEFNRIAGRGDFVSELIAFHRQREVLETVGYRKRKTLGRPRLEWPPIPWTQKAATQARSFATRGRRKIEKLLSHGGRSIE